MKTVEEAIQRKGKDLGQWNAAELREEYLLAARTLDVLQSIEDLRPQRIARMVPLKSLLPRSLWKETRGRKRDMQITGEQLLELVQIGRDDGDKFAKTTLQDFVKFCLTNAGLRHSGNMERMVKRLQKRLSEAKR